MRQTQCARLLLQLVTRELWRLRDTLKTIITKNYENAISVCFFTFKFFIFFYLFSFKTACMLGVIPQLIKLFKAKRAGGENLAEDPKRKLSQHHPRQGWTRAGNHTPCWALQVGNACQTHYMMPQVKDASQQSSPCLTATNNEWMPNPTTSMNLTWWVQLKPYEVFHHYTEDEVW